MDLRRKYDCVSKSRKKYKDFFEHGVKCEEFRCKFSFGNIYIYIWFETHNTLHSNPVYISLTQILFKYYEMKTCIGILFMFPLFYLFSEIMFLRFITRPDLVWFLVAFHISIRLFQSNHSLLFFLTKSFASCLNNNNNN